MSTRPPDTDLDTAPAETDTEIAELAGAPVEPAYPVGFGDDPTLVPPPPIPPDGVAFEPMPERPADPARQFPVGRITFSVILILAGTLGLLSVSSLEVSAQGVLAAALVATGLGLVVGAWLGRPRGLVALGVVLTLALGATAAIGVPLQGGIGERVIAPDPGVALPAAYHLGIGELVVDLSDVDLAGDRVALETTLGVGELVVVVPSDVDVEVTAEVTAGELDLFGRVADGMSVSDRAVSETPGDADGVLLLDVRVGLGRVEVRRAPDLGEA